jgi:hypothetical protein
MDHLIALCFTVSSAVHAWEFMICEQQAAVISSISHLFSVTVCEQCGMSWCSILYSNLYLCMNDIYVKYRFVRKRRWKIRCKFRDERVPSIQTIQNLVNTRKLRTTGLLIHKKQKPKRRVLTEEKLDDIGARLEHAHRKPLKCLAQETGVSKSSSTMVTQLLKLRPCKMHALQPHDPVNRVHFCSLLLQSVVEREIDQQLTFFPDEEWFHLQRYINMQNNRYCSSQNPHLTQGVPLHPVKVGVWCAVSARRIAWPVFFLMKQLIAKDIYM